MIYRKVLLMQQGKPNFQNCGMQNIDSNEDALKNPGICIWYTCRRIISNHNRPLTESQYIVPRIPIHRLRRDEERIFRAHRCIYDILASQCFSNIWRGWSCGGFRFSLRFHDVASTAIPNHPNSEFGLTCVRNAWRHSQPNRDILKVACGVTELSCTNRISLSDLRNSSRRPFSSLGQ